MYPDEGFVPYIYDDKYLYELNGNVVDTTYFGALKRYSMSVTYILYTTRLKDIYS